MRLLYLSVITAAFMSAYLWNGYKFVTCDFESNYKCEIIHGVGVVVPPISWITVWFDSDNKGK